MEPNPNNIKIGIVDLKERGGRKTFVDNFYRCLKKHNYNVFLVGAESATLKDLNTFDILHFSSISSAKKALFISKKVKKILTIHGWVQEEIIGSMKSKNFYQKAYLALMLISWKIVRYFIPLFFDAIVYPSGDTAKKIGLSGTVISNGIFVDEYNDIKPKDVRNNKTETIFVSYSSNGGLKDRAVGETISIVNNLNKGLADDKHVILLIFGEVSEKIIGDDFVRLMGRRKDFLEILKSADIFITCKDFPDLGYAEIKTSILGVPVAKLISGTEEIKDNITGILAADEQEMVKKLKNYIGNLEYNKKMLGQSLKNYIIANKNLDALVKEWQKLFYKLLKN